MAKVRSMPDSFSARTMRGSTPSSTKVGACSSTLASPISGWEMAASAGSMAASAITPSGSGMPVLGIDSGIGTALGDVLAVGFDVGLVMFGGWGLPRVRARSRCRRRAVLGTSQGMQAEPEPYGRTVGSIVRTERWATRAQCSGAVGAPLVTFILPAHTHLFDHTVFDPNV